MQGQPASNSLRSDNLAVCLTSLPGTSRYTKPLPKSPCHTLRLRRKVLEMGPVFCFIDRGSQSNNQLRKSKARSESFTNGKTFSRAILRFSKLVYKIIRGKNTKQKRVKSRKVLLIVKAAAKLCCRRRSLYSTKTRNQGRVVFPSEISTLPLTPHFCSETSSIILRHKYTLPMQNGAAWRTYICKTFRPRLCFSSMFSQ